jgi:trigger factor
VSDIQVKIETAGPCRKLLTIEVASAAVDSQYKKMLDLYSKRARIPGFRPGKAPAQLVERHYGKDMREEVKDHLLAFGYRGALDQEKLRPVATVDVTDESPILAGSPFSFKVTVDLPPTFDLPSYNGIQIEIPKNEVTDAQVEEAVTQFRDRMARFNEIKDRAVKSGDILKIDYHGVCGDQPVETLAPASAGLGQGKDFWLRTDESADADFLPGVAKAVEGMELGSTREIAVSFPADYHVKEVAGKTAAYTITVKDIREKTLPEMDEEFFKMAGVANLDELKARIRDNLESAAERNAAAQRLDAAAKHLLEHTRIDELPQTQVQSEAQQIVMNIVRENTMRGVSSDQIKDQRESILNAATRSSEDRVKLTYILDRIAETEKIEVTEGDVTTHIAMMAARRRQAPDKLRAELQKDDRIEGVRHDLRNEKALEFVVKNAAVKVA